MSDNVERTNEAAKEGTKCMIGTRDSAGREAHETAVVERQRERGSKPAKAGAEGGRVDGEQLFWRGSL